MTERENNIGKHSKVTLAVLVGAVLITLSGAAEYNSLKNQVSQIAHDQWTVTQQLKWTSEMQKLNPTINVPIPLLSAETARAKPPTNLILAAQIQTENQ